MRTLTCALALLLPCLAQASPDAQPRGDYYVQVTNRHQGAETVERSVLSSRPGSEPGTTELSVRPAATARDGGQGLPLPTAPTRVVLNADGEPVSGNPQLAQAIHLALGAKAEPQRRVALPGGGWFLLKTRTAPTVRKVLKGDTVDVLRLRQRVEGTLSSGEGFTGEIRYTIQRALDGQLVRLRGVQRLRVAGQVLETVVEIARDPFGSNANPATPQDRRVGLAPNFRGGSSLASAPALGCLLFVVLGLGARGLGKRRSLCLLLCVTTKTGSSCSEMARTPSSASSARRSSIESPSATASASQEATSSTTPRSARPAGASDERCETPNSKATSR